MKSKKVKKEIDKYEWILIMGLPLMFVGLIFVGINQVLNIEIIKTLPLGIMVLGFAVILMIIYLFICFYRYFKQAQEKISLNEEIIDFIKDDKDFEKKQNYLIGCIKKYKNN